MLARMLLALAAIVAGVAARVQSPKAMIYIDAATNSEELEEVEKRYTPELIDELHSASADAMLLFTEYTAKAGGDLKDFVKNISSFPMQITSTMDSHILNNAPLSCRAELESRLKKIEYDAHKAANFNAENHHKFYLGHMIVFRMHLNKSEDYIKKCERVIKGCGIPCETTPRIIRWRRLAAEEINRVKEDIQHCRRYYRDVLIHARRKLNHLRKNANNRAQTVIQKFDDCVKTE